MRASCEAIGLCQLAFEFGLEFRGRVFADASAALGVVNRRGAGRLRHVRIGSLWVQEAQASGSLEYRKVAGSENPADLLTKGLRAEPMRYLVSSLGLEYRAGSAAVRLQLAAFLFGPSAQDLSPPEPRIRGGVYECTTVEATFRDFSRSSYVANHLASLSLLGTSCLPASEPSAGRLARLSPPSLACARGRNGHAAS